jgi:hypothetical protein
MTLQTPAVRPDRTAPAPPSLPADVFEAIVSATAAAVLAEILAGTVASRGGYNRGALAGAEIGQFSAGAEEAPSGDAATAATQAQGDAA